MIIHYHWGLGVGHLYSHWQVANISTMPVTTQHSDNGSEQETSTTPAVNMVPGQSDGGNDCETDDPKLCAENCEDCNWVKRRVWRMNEKLMATMSHDGHDELLVAFDDMYGPQDTFDVCDW